MVRETSQMFITGPDVVRPCHRRGGRPRRAGRRRRTKTSGVAHFGRRRGRRHRGRAGPAVACCRSNNRERRRPTTSTRPEPTTRWLDTFIPDSANQPYDMHEEINEPWMTAISWEVQALFATNIVIGFARVDGQRVGIVANQPMHLAGCLDIDASEKAARFVRTCDAFNVPLITLVDVPGFLPGVGQEHATESSVAAQS